MKIERIESWKEGLALTRPYKIATRTITSVDLLFIRIITDDGVTGLGSASPAEQVTGESAAACETALGLDRLEWLKGREICKFGGLCRTLGERLYDTPAARAAVDMALHDLMARKLGLPLVEFLGRCHDTLPTSITIGIKSTAEALDEAEEYLGRGFTHLKVKIGLCFEEDVERLTRIREKVGRRAAIRVDGNQGYGVDETLLFEQTMETLEIELLEQPIAAPGLAILRKLPPHLRSLIAADESLLTEGDALELAQPPGACGIFNIKLMKCGGITPALRIACIAEVAEIELMWGCMDESAISIAAALHAAFATPATRYLDLDGSFDLARDLAEGGFVVEAGNLRLADGPGLGVRLVD